MNSKWHLYCSILKSTIRILSILAAVFYREWMLLAIGFCIAECLGVAEELADDR